MDVVHCYPPNDPYGLFVEPQTLSDEEDFKVIDFDAASTSRETSSISSGSSSANQDESDKSLAVVRSGCPEDCAVCGDRSTGYHYDVPSCNGCKTFFRRTLLAQRKFSCKKSGKCFEVLPKEKRCACRSCRYEKCVEVGMNPLAIVTGDDLTRNSMLKDMLLKRKQVIVPADAAPPAKIMRRMSTPEDFVDCLIDGLRYVEMKYDGVRRSVYNPRSDSDLTFSKLLQEPTSFGIKYEEMPDWPLANDPCQHRIYLPLEDYIKLRIKIPKVNVSTLPKNHKQWFYVDTIYAIDYVKTFDFFGKLKTQDQMCFVKSVCGVIANITSSYFSYSNKSDVMLYPDGRTPYKRNEQFSASRTPYHIIRSLSRLKLDRTEYVLLKAILLCSGTMDSLSDEGAALIRAEKEKYAKSLMAYILTSRGPAAGPATYAGCMGIIDTIYHQEKRKRQMSILLTALKLMEKSKLSIELDHMHDKADDSDQSEPFMSSASSSSISKSWS